MTAIKRVGYTVAKLDENSNLYMEQIVDADNNTVHMPPESLGYVKQLELTVIFTRTATDNLTLTEKTGFFKQTLKLTFDNPKTSKYAYFYYNPKQGMQNVCIKDLDTGFCFNISLNKPASPENYRIYEICYGKPTRITKQTAIKLLQDKQALLFDSEDLASTTAFRGKI